MLDRAARLTPGALRAAIARAVMEVAPDKARERRETAARDARVERWIEDSGNAALMGCELPPDEVLAADQRITAWAHELNKAGLDGGMDQLRARAYLDLLLGKDSRPRPADPQPNATTSTTSPTRQAAAAACATPAPNAATTTGSSSTPAGRSTSCPTAPSAGPPRPAAPTPPNPPATPSDGAGGHKSRTRLAEGWEQQIRTLPSAGSSTGSGE